MLWGKLRDLMLRGARCVHCVEKAEILPENTRYYAAQVPYIPGNKREVKDTRARMRELWLEGATHAMKGAALVFLDPDNGLGEEGDKNKAGGAKDCYPGDIEAFWNAGHSVAFIHHPGREQIPDDYPATEAVRQATGQDPIILRLRHATAPLFYIVPQDRHRPMLLNRLTKFADKWQEHFRGA